MGQQQSQEPEYTMNKNLEAIIVVLMDFIPER